MAKRNQRNKRTGKRGRKQPGQQSQRPKLSWGLDYDALRYAKLLADPCGGELCHPLYAGVDGGVVARFETDFIYFNGATETCGAMVWTPGAVGATAGTTNSLVNIVAASPGASATANNTSVNFLPGYTFLAATAKAVRPVSACLQVYWPGTEMNRAGYITYGNCDGLALEAGASYFADGVGQIFQKSERMPTSYAEIKWKPMAGDQDWTDPSQANPLSDVVKRGAVGFVVKGIPVSTGVRIRLVSVYEYQPKTNQGMCIPYNSRSKSNNTMDQVVNYLDSFGDWATSLGRIVGSGMRVANNVGRAGQTIAYAASRIPAIMV